MHTIEDTIEIEAPAHQIIEALTTQAGLRAWFTQTATVDGDGDRKEATFTFARPDVTRTQTFQLDHHDETSVAMTCTRVHNTPDWLGTRLSISVEGRHVRLVHAGYPAKNEYFEQCTQGWAYFLASLKSYLETGRGTPFPAA